MKCKFWQSNCKYIICWKNYLRLQSARRDSRHSSDAPCNVCWEHSLLSRTLLHFLLSGKVLNICLLLKSLKKKKKKRNCENWLWQTSIWGCIWYLFTPTCQLHSYVFMDQSISQRSLLRWPRHREIKIIASSVISVINFKILWFYTSPFGNGIYGSGQDMKFGDFLGYQWKFHRNLIKKTRGPSPMHVHHVSLTVLFLWSICTTSNS